MPPGACAPWRRGQDAHVTYAPKLPAAWRSLTSLEATTRLIERAHVGVAPGTGFGARGEGYVRFALIEDPPRINEACERIREALKG